MVAFGGFRVPKKKDYEDMYFDFDWGEETNYTALSIQNDMKKASPETTTGIRALLIASVVTSRGKRQSPSSVLEELLKKKRRTNPDVRAHIEDAWNVLTEPIETASLNIDTLGTLLTTKHRSNKGVSETLKYQLSVTYESFLDAWTAWADMICGFRTVATKVFGATKQTELTDYMHRGMRRGQILQAFGDDIKPPEADDTDEDDE